MIRRIEIKTRWTVASALDAVGGLSNPSKMPGLGTSIPAQACPIGSKLVDVKGSVCEGCYAFKGAYAWNNVKSALGRRLDILRECEHDETARDRWISAHAFLLNARLTKWTPNSPQDHRFFRWHDSGDVQGLWHLLMIAAVAAETPGVSHWLPTRELPTVREFYRAWGLPPNNLRIRISANKVGAPLPKVEGFTASGVHTVKGDPENGAVECPAVYNDNACGDCRACWSDAPAISYLQH